MKKAILTLMCMAAMMMAGTSLKAQEITIVLNPGWTWISCPSTDTLDFTTAFGSFTPAIGDIIKSKWGAATYTADGQWRGSVSLFYPGYGYHYKSNRTEPVIVTFNAQQPAPQRVVTTSEPTDITHTSAVVGGTVTLDESNHIYTRGVCWRTEQMPTVDDNHISDGTGTGSFTIVLTGLTPNITYYVRAYTVTDYGLTYGDEQSFTTLDNSSNGDVPEGAINGLFTINANGDQVYFSNGNLQYQPLTNTWRFAENQSDILISPDDMTAYQSSTGYYYADVSSQYTPSYDGWIDLFGWGTSGYDNTTNDQYAINYQPWSTSTGIVNEDYNAYGYGPSTNMADMNLVGTSANYDWGIFNAISNGGNQTGQWRTLSQAEWSYITYSRTDAALKRGTGKVNDVNGAILLPDDWTLPNGLNFIPINNSSEWDNSYTCEQWTLMEANGAVFLPAAGIRLRGTSVFFVGSDGHYWSSTYRSLYNTFRLHVVRNYFSTADHGERNYCMSVRLVKDYEP